MQNLLNPLCINGFRGIVNNFLTGQHSDKQIFVVRKLQHFQLIRQNIFELKN
jgi:hypothetical protein